MSAGAMSTPGPSIAEQHAAAALRGEGETVIYEGDGRWSVNGVPQTTPELIAYCNDLRSCAKRPPIPLPWPDREWAETIAAHTATAAGVDRAVLRTRTHDRQVRRIRHLAICLCRLLTDLPMRVICADIAGQTEAGGRYAVSGHADAIGAVPGGPRTVAAAVTDLIAILPLPGDRRAAGQVYAAELRRPDGPRPDVIQHLLWGRR